MSEWTKEARDDLYQRATELWGTSAQIDQLVEELGECVVATQKLFRRDYSERRRLELASEFADVQIMLEQVTYILDNMTRKAPDMSEKSFAELVSEQVEYKLTRTFGRVSDQLVNYNKVE